MCVVKRISESVEEPKQQPVYDEITQYHEEIQVEGNAAYGHVIHVKTVIWSAHKYFKSISMQSTMSCNRNSMSCTLTHSHIYIKITHSYYPFLSIYCVFLIIPGYVYNIRMVHVMHKYELMPWITHGDSD